MMPVIEHKYYTGENVVQENGNVCSDFACDEKKDVVE